MSNYISEKTKWVSTDGWRGYEQYINAVGGANNTGSWGDSPCPSNVCEKEIKDFRKLLRLAGIPNKVKVGRTSNVFCAHVYVLVGPEDRERALEIAQNHEKETRLFYSCN